MNIENEIINLQKMMIHINNEINKLKKDSHPKVEGLNSRLVEKVEVINTFFDNIYEITTITNEENDNGMVN